MKCVNCWNECEWSPVDGEAILSECCDDYVVDERGTLYTYDDYKWETLCDYGDWKNQEEKERRLWEMK